jgi:hypothetical protein
VKHFLKNVSLRTLAIGNITQSFKASDLINKLGPQKRKIIRKKSVIEKRHLLNLVGKCGIAKRYWENIDIFCCTSSVHNTFY